MKRTFCACLLAGLLIGAPAAEWRGDVIKLTEAEAKECIEDGDCVLFTKREFAAVLRAQRLEVMQQANKACAFGGVGRDS